METITLNAALRNLGEKAHVLRSRGKVPAVYYGRGVENKHLIFDYQEFRKVFEKAGENTIVELHVDGGKVPVLVHDIQYDPVSDQIAHVDLQHVDMNQEVTTTVKLHFIGVSPAVKNLGGVMDVQKHEVHIKCLPKDLIHSIDVDITGLSDFHTALHIKDLKVPSTVKILEKEDESVVSVAPPREEKEETPAATTEAAPSGGEAAPTQEAAPAEGAQKAA